MSPQYQTPAAEKFQAWAAENQNPIQLSFPTPNIVQLAQQGLGDLLRRVGQLFIENVLEAEATQLAGPRSQPDPQREAYRWGSEQGYCVIDGQKVPIARPRLRSKAENREMALGSYELFQRASLVEENVWHKIMHGLFKGANLVVAIGIDYFGHKIVLGLRQGATENAVVVGELLGELAERGVDFTQPRLYIVDGGKAIRRAILDHAGEAAFLPRCQVHKIRNVCEHLPEAQHHAIRFQMRAAYEKTETADARQALYRLHDQLLEANPSAAASLAEGLEETLTVLELRITPRLRRSLSSTNGIESSFSITERICQQVKRWQGSDHRLRWVASSLMFAESRWNRLHGYRHIPVLGTALKTAYALRLQQQRAALRRQVNAA